ncbi:MAG: cupredoxin domain-containing protein [Patescibacteria group bacterium]|jgi:uncharacterized cupredoxin-like copper-binding protein
MENNKVASTKKKLLPIIAVIVVVLVIAGIVILTNKKSAPTPNTPGEQTETTPEGQTGENAESPVAATGTVVNPILEGARTEAPGADLVSKTGQVVNQEGEAVKTDVAYNSPEAPKQTLPVAIAEIPLASKLTLDANGFTPKEFRIAKGKALTIALTGSADSSHVFAFESPLLKAVYINVRPGETRATTFNAPTVAGEYVFFCDFPGHKDRGEVGKMIVE